MVEISRRYVQSYGVSTQQIQRYVSQSLLQMEQYVNMMGIIVEQELLTVHPRFLVMFVLLDL